MSFFLNWIDRAIKLSFQRWVITGINWLQIEEQVLVFFKIILHRIICVLGLTGFFFPETRTRIAHDDETRRVSLSVRQSLNILDHSRTFYGRWESFLAHSMNSSGGETRVEIAALLTHVFSYWCIYSAHRRYKNIFRPSIRVHVKWPPRGY